MIGSSWRAFKLAVDEALRVIAIIDLAGEGKQRSITGLRKQKRSRRRGLVRRNKIRARRSGQPSVSSRDHAALRRGIGQPPA